MSTALDNIKNATALAVSGAALLLGSISAQAGLTIPESSCGLPIQLGNPQASAVLSNTQGPTDGPFSYNFTVCNLSDPGFFNGENEGRVSGDAIRDWELPWDPAADIAEIMVPAGWSWSLETKGVENGATGWEGVIEWQTAGDPFGNLGFDNHDQVLHFYTGCGEGNPTSAEALASSPLLVLAPPGI